MTGAFDVASERTPGSLGVSVSSGVAATVAADAQFDYFYRSEYRSVLKLVRPLTRSLCAAEDVAQEAFVRALRNWKDVADHPSPEAWVRRAALNLACSRWRRLRSEAGALMRLGPPQAQEAPRLANQELWSAVGSLPKRQQQVVLLFYVDDMSVRDVADVLGIEEGTVKATLSHARARLAHDLGVRHDD